MLPNTRKQSIRARRPAPPRGAPHGSHGEQAPGHQQKVAIFTTSILVSVWILVGSSQSPEPLRRVEDQPTEIPPTEAIAVPPQPTDEQLDAYGRQVQAVLDRPAKMPEPYVPDPDNRAERVAPDNGPDSRSEPPAPYSDLLLPLLPKPSKSPAPAGSDTVDKDSFASAAPARPAPYLDTYEYPGSAIAKTTGCSASVIGDFHLLTAAHCLIDASENWTHPTAFPGQTNKTPPVWTDAMLSGSQPALQEWIDRPFGDAQSVYARVYNFDELYPDPNRPYNVDSTYDVGLITLDRPIGRRLAPLTLRGQPQSGFSSNWPTSISTYGYPTEVRVRGESFSNPIPNAEIRQYRGFGSQRGLDYWYDCRGFWPLRYDCGSASFDAYTYGGHSGGAARQSNRLGGVLSGSDRQGEIWVALFWKNMLSWINNRMATDERVRAPAEKPELIEYILQPDSKDLLTASVVAGGSIRVKYNVFNVGFAGTGRFAIRFYLSRDREIRSSGDTLLATYSGDNIAASSYGVWNADLRVPAGVTSGNYYVGYIFSSEVNEYNPFNNVVVIDKRVTVSGRPDLVVSAASVADDTLDAGQAVFLSYTITNRGNGHADGPYRVTAFRSANATISLSDTPIGTQTIGGTLGPGGSFSRLTIRVPGPPSPGTWYYGVCVHVLGESNSANNCSRGVPVVVSGGRPDLVVSAGVDDDTLDVGQTTFLNYTIRNQGNGAAPGSPWVTAFRSADATISWDDTSIWMATHVNIESLGRARPFLTDTGCRRRRAPVLGTMALASRARRVRATPPTIARRGCRSSCPAADPIWWCPRVWTTTRWTRGKRPS